jgi:hypothetical protein
MQNISHCHFSLVISGKAAIRGFANLSSGRNRQSRSNWNCWRKHDLPCGFAYDLKVNEFVDLLLTIDRSARLRMRLRRTLKSWLTAAPARSMLDHRYIDHRAHDAKTKA